MGGIVGCGGKTGETEVIGGYADEMTEEEGGKIGGTEEGMETFGGARSGEEKFG